jgi:predicted nucleic acid-binding protein
MPDLQIAAIALTRGADVIATRNVRRFEDCGLQAIDPWQVARGSAAPA